MAADWRAAVVCALLPRLLPWRSDRRGHFVVRLFGAGAVLLLPVVQLTSLWPGATARGDELPEAQVELAGNDVLAGLEHVDECLKDEQWEEAVETLARLMENHGSALVETPVRRGAGTMGFGRFTTLRDYGQLQLARWSREAPLALAAYRDRVDAVAERWYDEAAARRDESQLQRIVDELMLSSSGDDALLLLGELALERGNCTLARSVWERLSPRLRVTPAAAAVLEVSPGCSWWRGLRGRELAEVWPDLEEALKSRSGEWSWPAYPDTDISLASVRARLVLVSLLEGSRERAELEYELLARLHPQAAGKIGGQTGRYAELVAALREEAADWPGPPPLEGWSTLGGTPRRSGVAEQAVDIAQRPVWETTLPRLQDTDERVGSGRRRVAEKDTGLLSYHVAVCDGVVFWAQPAMVRAVKLRTGEPAWPYPLGARRPDEPSYGAIYRWSRAPRDVIPQHAAHMGVPRYSVTVAHDRLFARLGKAWTGGGNDRRVRADQRSFLIGIDLRTQKLIFDKLPPGEPGWEFESAPLATAEHLFVSLRRRGPASSQARVACFAISTGKLLWQRDVVRGETVGGVLYELANGALALDDDMLYYSTGLGAVAALRAADGRIAWIYRYPRAGLRGDDPERDDRHWFRDLTPCLVHGELVIAAPPDCDRLIALDRVHGRIVWATPPGVAADARHLVGVREGTLVASGDTLYWMDIDSGRLRDRFPAMRSSAGGPATARPRGHGRPVMAGEQVYWPTSERIYVFDQNGRRQLRQPIELAAMGVTGGNLVVVDDTLLIAGAERLVAFNRRGRVVDEAVSASVRNSSVKAPSEP